MCDKVEINTGCIYCGGLGLVGTVDCLICKPKPMDPKIKWTCCGECGPEEVADGKV